MFVTLCFLCSHCPLCRRPYVIFLTLFPTICLLRYVSYIVVVLYVGDAFVRLALHFTRRPHVMFLTLVPTICLLRYVSYGVVVLYAEDAFIRVA
jgi:hypothetical protein